MAGLDVGALLGAVVLVALALAVPVAVLWLLVKLCVGVFWFVGAVVGGVGRGLELTFRGVGGAVTHTWTFASNTVSDSLRSAGAVVTALVFSILAIVQIVLGRWSTANHYGRAIEEEYRRAGLSVYRLAIGNPARFLGLRAMTEGLERRLPEVIARAPRGDRPRGLREFDGYEVVDTLPRGGSGAWLFLARTSPEKRDLFAAQGQPPYETVVLKSFSLDEGSTLPQIVRESRALEAAREMGLVLEHELTDERFFYAMPYVDGRDLGAASLALHEQGGEKGLEGPALSRALEWTADVLQALHRFHARGLWHKDIKPSNVIVARGEAGIERAHLVDLGLVTPLRSAMTLTTHGTEYFRDPEMVRLAMQGVKVHEVDGVKFDLYSVGALLFSLLENSFPAHGSLSQIEKRCPEALRWVVRRAMADMKQRYASAEEMLADVRAVLAAEDAFAMKPAQLPSMGGAEPGGFSSDGRVAMPDDRPAVGDPLARSFTAPMAEPAASVSEARAKERAKDRKKRQGVVTGVLGAVAIMLLFPLVIGGLYALRGLDPVVNVGYDRDIAAGSIPPGVPPIPDASDVSVVPAPWSPAAQPASSPAAPAASEPWAAEYYAPRMQSWAGTDSEHWRSWVARMEERLQIANDGDVEAPRALVLNELPAGTSQNFVDGLSFVLWQLGQQSELVLEGNDVIGRELGWLAEVRELSGGAPMHDEDAIDLLETWLDVNEHVDGILWIGLSDSGRAGRYRLVVSEPDSDEVAAGVPSLVAPD